MAYPNTILADVLQALLANGEQSLTDAGIELPERRFVSHGQPPGEPTTCPETLAAWASLISTPPKPASQTGAGCSTKSVLTLNLTLYRCVPTVDENGIPPADVLDASGKSLAEQGWVLWFGMLKAWGDGTLFADAGVGKCEAFDPQQGALSLPPQGGLAGWNIVGRLTL